MNKKFLAGAAATTVLALGAGGAGIAYATGGDSAEQQATGPKIEQAKSIALDHIKGGRVTGTEVGDEEGAYEVEVTRDDGSQVDVHLDRNLKILSTPTDHEGPDGKDAPNDN